jgi:hypothetical protein
MSSGGDTYQTFHIHIRPMRSEAHTYQITLFQRGVPVLGGPSRPTALISAADVQAIRRDYEEQVKLYHELTELDIPTLPLEPHKLLELGQRIAQLLPQTAREGLVEAVQRVQREDSRLRILLEVAPDARLLFGVPWELMVLPLTSGAQTDAGGEGFLLHNANISLIRQVQGIGSHTLPNLELPLTLQAIAATPRDGDSIDTEPTRAALEHLLGPEVLEQSWYDGPNTLAVLHDRIRSAKPQILHLICHGTLSDTGRSARSDLLFTHRDGLTQRVTAFDLAPALTLTSRIQLVILQACFSGTMHDAPWQSKDHQQERQAVETIALSIVRQGIPTVVAMQGEVGQDVVNAFVRNCYTLLAEGAPLDYAVAVGRTAMQAAGGTVDWSLPVVYQGSGQAQPSTWYTRLADRADAGIKDPTVQRTFRGIWICWVLLLVVIGIVRWLMAPIAAIDVDTLRLALTGWAIVGLVGPAIISAVQNHDTRTDLSRQVYSAARRARWLGAYLGYALSGLALLTLMVSFWLIGVFAILPTAINLLLFGLALLAALAGSYIISRSQFRSALAIAPLNPELFNLPITLLVVGAMLLLILAPLSVFWIANTPLAFVLAPAPAALALALVILTFIFTIRE